MNKRLHLSLLFLLFLILLPLFINGCSFGLSPTQQDVQYSRPGTYEDYTLLPNGWRLTPAGTQHQIGQLPLNMIVTKDEKYILSANSGYSEHSISVIGTDSGKEIQRFMINKIWRGICFGKDESVVFASGGENHLIYILDFHKGKLSLRDSIMLMEKGLKEIVSPTGICYHKERKRLFVVSKENNSLYSVDIENKAVDRRIKLPAEAYDIVLNPVSGNLFVSIWGGKTVVEIDPMSVIILREIEVKNHPTEMVLSPDGKFLFVANANYNSVSVIDCEQGRAIVELNAAIAPDLPPGSTPNSLAISSDGKLLYVANADNNFLTLFDITNVMAIQSLGFIPTGWYPTVVRVLSDNRIFVANGKGSGSLANREGPNPVTGKKTEQYIGDIINSSLSIIPGPGSNNEIVKYSLQVYKNTPITNTYKPEPEEQLVVPVQHGKQKSNKIKYVFYVIKENRTYDQVFGDIEGGNGDSSLCIFGEMITPNQHKLAKDFVLFDNFYVDAEVSADGHNWSMAAYASDFVEKTWPTYYGGRGGRYDYEGGRKLASPSSGYIWDRVISAGLQYRNYGEYVMRIEEDGKYKYVPRDDYLYKYTCTSFPGFDMSISDITRYEEWEKDFSLLLAAKAVPNLSIIRLGNDHTAGTRKGSLTPRAYVAQNDYAVGKLVERISNSEIWKESIIFITEDDAQNGSDHIDAHRSILMVISPYVKRNYIDHQMYTTSGILKTIELILGLQPMTQYDLAARPILGIFNNDAKLRPFKAILPKWDIKEVNPPNAYGSARCEELNLTVEDAIPDVEFNEIIWKSIKGVNSVMPPPVRSAFINYIETEEDESERQ